MVRLAKLLPGDGSLACRKQVLNLQLDDARTTDSEIGDYEGRLLCGDLDFSELTVLKVSMRPPLDRKLHCLTSAARSLGLPSITASNGVTANVALDQGIASTYSREASLSSAAPTTSCGTFKHGARSCTVSRTVMRDSIRI